VTLRDRWYLAAMIGLPLVTITMYLLWIWPRPRGVSVLAEIGPYLLSLLTGLPFAWILTRGRNRAWRLLGFFGGGFVLLWIYALAVLCGVRGVCL
jgi:accessory gene regulator protein AgrB